MIFVIAAQFALLIVAIYYLDQLAKKNALLEEEVAQRAMEVRDLWRISESRGRERDRALAEAANLKLVKPPDDYPVGGCG